MKERPILFSAPMVRAILRGDKVQTRRVIKPQPETYHDSTLTWTGKVNANAKYQKPPYVFSQYGQVFDASYCPYGEIGDVLWVRETFFNHNDSGIEDASQVEYKASKWCREAEMGGNWKPSISMPKWASRIKLKIKNIRVERLQDISEEDAIAEGIEVDELGHAVRSDDSVNWGSAKGAYAELWSKINGEESWNANPWVWVIEFKRL